MSIQLHHKSQYMDTLQLQHQIIVHGYFQNYNTIQIKQILEKNFKILDKGNNDFEITIKESLMIKKNTPPLNKKLMTQGPSFLLKIFV